MRREKENNCNESQFVSPLRTYVLVTQVNEIVTAMLPAKITATNFRSLFVKKKFSNPNLTICHQQVHKVRPLVLLLK
jgi:hypothetical protein